MRRCSASAVLRRRAAMERSQLTAMEVAACCSASLSSPIDGYSHHGEERGGAVRKGKHPLYQSSGGGLGSDSSEALDRIHPTEMCPVFPESVAQDGVASASENECTKRDGSGRGREASDEESEPLARGLRNTHASTPYRVSWFTHAMHVSPSKAFVYWSYRRLRLLPPEWREYYRRMLRQEVKAARYVNQTWDVFMMVVDGYRKAKWVLAKYGVPVDEGSIPRPYNNFWEETTHEERVWAHRRSTQLKDLQAMQRDEDSLIFGAGTMDRREAHYSSLKNVQGGMQAGSPVHANDLPAPHEGNVAMSRADEEMSSAMMSSIEDDKLWNPVLKARLHKQDARIQAESFGFEDDDDEGDSSASGPNIPPPKFRNDFHTLV